MVFLESLRLAGFLSFPPGAGAVPLTPLNVLIGPNGSGKTNLIEGIELLHSTPTTLAGVVREGGTAQEWLWKGDPSAKEASVNARVSGTKKIPTLDYHLAFTPSGQRMEVLSETVKFADTKATNATKDVLLHRLHSGRAVLKIRRGSGRESKKLKPQDVVPDESLLSQRKDPDLYPEVTWLGQQFARIQTFRDWTFGRSAPLRIPQRADFPIDELVSNSGNLGLVLNELQHTDRLAELGRLLTRFLPRYQRFSTRVQGGTVQLYLHESGLNSPVPATRLSDGTIRFMAILALLLSPTPPPLLCMEEPELGLHPDAVLLLADLLAETSARIQLIVTTHSEALVSALTEHADSVLVCQHLGETTLRRVDAGRIAHLLERYRLGELWTMGELGGNP